MRLDDYLDVLRKGRMQVCDNFNILLDADFEETAGNLGRYSFKRIINNGRTSMFLGKVRSFPIEVQLMGLRAVSTTFVGFPKTKEERKHSEYQLKNYKSALIFINENRNLRHSAREIAYFGEYIRNNGIAACFANSAGVERPIDCSKIVYYQDLVDRRMNGRRR